MYTKLTAEEKQARKQARKDAIAAHKKGLKILEKLNQKPVKLITIDIIWVKHRLWGHNPHATARVEYQDGYVHTKDNYTCSGCGYDKESTVIANIFNDFLSYKLFRLDQRNNHPYGIELHDNDCYYADAIGTDCYKSIAKAINGEFKNTYCNKVSAGFQYVDYDDISTLKLIKGVKHE